MSLVAAFAFEGSSSSKPYVGSILFSGRWESWVVFSCLYSPPKFFFCTRLIFISRLSYILKVLLSRSHLLCFSTCSPQAWILSAAAAILALAVAKHLAAATLVAAASCRLPAKTPHSGNRCRCRACPRRRDACRVCTWSLYCNLCVLSLPSELFTHAEGSRHARIILRCVVLSVMFSVSTS